jgi:hypothetical protein
VYVDKCQVGCTGWEWKPHNEQYIAHGQLPLRLGMSSTIHPLLFQGVPLLMALSWIQDFYLREGEYERMWLQKGSRPSCPGLLLLLLVLTVIFRVQFLSFQPAVSHLGRGLSIVDEIFIKSVQYPHSGSVPVQPSVHKAELVFSLNLVIASLPALQFFHEFNSKFSFSRGYKYPKHTANLFPWKNSNLILYYVSWYHYFHNSPLVKWFWKMWISTTWHSAWDFVYTSILILYLVNYDVGSMWRILRILKVYTTLFWPQSIMDWYRAQYIEFTKSHQVKQIVESSNISQTKDRAWNMLSANTKNIAILLQQCWKLD